MCSYGRVDQRGELCYWHGYVRICLQKKIVKVCIEKFSHRECLGSRNRNVRSLAILDRHILTVSNKLSLLESLKVNNQFKRLIFISVCVLLKREF